MNKITIITSSFNSDKTIRFTLDSVLNQNYPNIDHIIIDGGSSDKTLEIISKYINIKKVISEKDNGIYDAMNKGISIANGDVIGILNSDDIYSDDKVISSIMKEFEDPSIDAVYGDLNYVDYYNTHKILRQWKAGKHKLYKWKYGWMPPHPAFFARKRVYEKYGTFNLDLKSSADYEIMLRFLFKYRIKVKYLPHVLVHMRVGGQSNASLKNRILANQEDKEAWKMNDLKPFPFTTLLKPIRKIPQYFKKYNR